MVSKIQCPEQKIRIKKGLPDIQQEVLFLLRFSQSCFNLYAFITGKLPFFKI
ncbi:hypothetical protein P869_02380 [Ligilactobacillus ruminis S23]|nr:hypothetical protein P869_02380 [Ligilactobacillus ruminis S23]